MSHGWHVILAATTGYWCDTETRAHLRTLPAAGDGTSHWTEGLYLCLVAGALPGSLAGEEGSWDELSHVAGLGQPAGLL